MPAPKKRPTKPRVYKTRPKTHPERYYYSGTWGGWVKAPAGKRRR